MRKREGIEPRYGRENVGADVVSKTEGHSKRVHEAMTLANPPGSETGARHHGTVGNSGGPLGSSTERRRVDQPTHREEARWPRGSRMSPYERGRGVTPPEHRETPRGARSLATSPTPRGGTMTTTGVERRANRARQAPQARSTALRHHCTVENLRAGFAALAGQKASGVDGVTKALYGQHLKDNVQALSQQLHQMSYRPQPVRRVEMPKENGSTRPLGINCVEDTIVQEMARRLLEAISEPVFIATS